MAPQLSLVRLEDLAVDIDELDLLSGGFTPTAWAQAVANEGDASVSEVITLKIQGSSQDNLASLVQSLDNKIKQANWHGDLSERYAVWLRAKLGNESVARQAMVLRAKRSPVVPLFDAPAGANNIARQYQLGLDRTPWWEDAYPYPTTTALTAINSIGGQAVLPETIRGDVNARLVRMSITPAAGGAGFGEYWIGFKSNRFGNPTDFVSTWALNLSGGGGALFNDTTATADSSAHNGNRITTTFATVTTLADRALIKVSDIVTGEDPANQRGRYLVLLRAKMSGGGTGVARVRIGQGYAISTTIYNPSYNSRVAITGAGWLFYEMGEISIPPSKSLTSYTVGNSSIVVQAELVSGTDNLHMDCLVLIPVDDASINVSTTDHASDYTLDILQRADDKIDVLTETGSGIITYPVTFNARNWSLPANDSSPVLILAGQLSAASNKLFNADIVYTYIPRWATLRGSET